MYMNNKVALLEAKAAMHKITKFFTHFLANYTSDYSFIFENEGNMDNYHNSYPNEHMDTSNSTVMEDYNTDMLTPKYQQRTSIASCIWKPMKHRPLQQR